MLRKIMLVEDEEDIRTVAMIALENVGGFQVESCSSGALALERLADFGPELVITDVMMPYMDGPGLLDALRRNGSDVPVIFMTAKVLPQEVAEFMSLGVLGVIAKPFDPMTLAAQVRDIWAGAGG